MPNREQSKSNKEVTEGNPGKRKFAREESDEVKRASQGKKVRLADTPSSSGDEEQDSRESLTIDDRITNLENNILGLIDKVKPDLSKTPQISDFLREMSHRQQMNDRLTKMENDVAKYIEDNRLVDRPGETQISDFLREMSLRHSS